MKQFAPVPYNDLNSRQKENYNFHKVAARLVEYGYTSIRLSDDFEGADFIALNVDGDTVLKVQLKGRLTIDRKYEGKGIFITFRLGERVFLYPHDEMVERIEARDAVGETVSWRDRGAYSWPSPPPSWALEILSKYELRA
jgi:hypothetical protein